MAIGMSCAFFDPETESAERRPAWSPRRAPAPTASWIDLPSAIGSEKGIPSSMMSAPPVDQGVDDLLGRLDVAGRRP